MSGASGFHERDEAEWAAGTVRGVRFWKLGRDDGADGALIGAYSPDPWADGENVASCKISGHRAPEPSCSSGCGFWAYWKPEYGPEAQVKRDSRGVIGVIEGYGRTLIGTKGFRCEKARIVGLALMFDVYAPASRGGSEWSDALPWLLGARESSLERHEDADVILSGYETVIGKRYPSARIYTSRDILLRLHPPTADYLTDDEPQAWERQAAPSGLPLSAGSWDIVPDPGRAPDPAVVSRLVAHSRGPHALDTFYAMRSGPGHYRPR